MTGYKTVIANLTMPFFIWLQARGIPLDPDTQMAVNVLVMAGMNVILRFFTTTPIFQAQAANAPVGYSGPPAQKLILPLLVMVSLALSACGGATPQQMVPRTARETITATGLTWASVATGFKVYAKLPRCSATVTPPCSTAAAVVQIGMYVDGSYETLQLARSAVALLPDNTAATAMPAATAQVVNQAVAAVSTADNALKAAQAATAPSLLPAPASAAVPAK